MGFQIKMFIFIDLNNSNIIIEEEHTELPLFDKTMLSESWEGITINSGTALITDATIRNASNALVLSVSIRVLIF